MCLIHQGLFYSFKFGFIFVGFTVPDKHKVRATQEENN